jgi:hypothetical protein
MSGSRVLSVLLAAIYVAIGCGLGGQRAGAKMLAFCSLSVLCIWYPEAFGNSVGGRITAPSLPSVVRVVGWMVLFAPVVATVLVWIDSIGVVPKMSWRHVLQAWGSLRR